MIRKSLMPVQAEERAAGGNKTAFLPPASPSLSRQGPNPIQEPRSRPDLCLVRRFSGAGRKLERKRHREARKL